MVYIAAVSSGATNHPAFKQRAIPNYTAARPSDLLIVGVPHAREIAYAGYKDNIDIFVSATSRQHKINTFTPGAKINLSRSTISPSFPPVDFIPGIALSSDQMNTLEAKFAGMEPVRRVIGKTTHLLLKKPNMALAENLVAGAMEHINPTPDHITPKAFLAGTYLTHILTEFLSTQTYPAWKSKDDRREDEQILQQMETAFQIGSVKREACERAESSKKSRVEPEEDNGEDEDTSMDDEQPEFVYDIKWDSLRESVLVAKPSPLPYTFNYGGIADVPNFPGLAFPYFDRMLIPDNLTLRSILSTYFLRCLGDSRDEQRRVFKVLKLGLEQLARTRLGAEFMHVFIGIKLAIETQTRLFIVNVSGDYAGFVLLGARFSVLIDNEWHDAMEPEQLGEVVTAMSSHAKALNDLSRLLSNMQLRTTPAIGGGKETIEPREIQSGHDLWAELQKRVIPEDDYDNLTDALRMISFSRNYKTINAENVAWAVDMMVKDADIPVPTDSPLYVPNAFTLLDDRLLKVLCTFGPDAFSFQNSSGSKYAITPASRSKDTNEEQSESGKGKVLPVVVVAIKGVLTALTDMRRTLKDKALTMDLRERAQKNRCIVFSGQQRDLVYSRLRVMVDSTGAQQAGVTEGKGKKRARDEDNIPTSAGGLLDLF